MKEVHRGKIGHLPKAVQPQVNDLTPDVPEVELGKLSGQIPLSPQYLRASAVKKSKLKS